MDFQAAADEIRAKGLITLKGLYSKDECLKFKEIANKVVSGFIEKKSPLIHQNCQFIINPFRHDKSFYPLLTNDTIDSILKILLDEDYVLINATMNNRRFRNDYETGYAKSLGDNWHTDSRYLGGKRLDEGFGYLVCVMLDDFKKENGGTLYVPGSHLVRTIPDRQGNYEHEVLEGEAGTVVILDSGIWHRAGDSTPQDRWAVFNLFGPWFMKPYFDFPKIVGEEEGKKLSSRYRRLLHFNSIPPLNEDERMSTLSKEVKDY